MAATVLILASVVGAMISLAASLVLNFGVVAALGLYFSATLILTLATLVAAALIGEGCE
jgi:ABC-type polysaccharide/polyol phosphate export permease